MEERLHLILKKRYVLVLFLILFLVLDSLVFILPYYLQGYTIPFGWDTAWYIRNMRLIAEQGIYSFFIKTHEINLFCILEYLFASTFNVSFMLTETILPIMISLLFPLVNFQIVRRFTGSWKLSLVAMAFTIIDYNIVRMTVDLHRNLFCLLLSEIAVFLILPRFLEKTSKKDFFIFVSLMVMAGLSQMETFAVVMVALFLLSLFYFKRRFFHASKLLWLCILTPILIVVFVEAPFLPSLIRGHMIFNPMYTTLYPHRQGFTAHLWNYVLSLGTGLIPLFIAGTYILFRNAMKYQKPLFQLLFFWNITVIAGSFLPVFNVRLPGWRFLLLVIFPPVALLGLAKLFLWRPSLSRAHALMVLLLKILLLVTLFTLNLAGIILNQQSVYRHWITKDIYHKLVWISNDTQCKACVVIMYLDKGAPTFAYAEFYRNWIWAVIGTKTNVYFGDLDSLLEFKPTNFEDPYMNMTSHIFWNDLENFTPEKANVYLIEDWYEPLPDNEKIREVERGIYRVECYENFNVSSFLITD